MVHANSSFLHFFRFLNGRSLLFRHEDLSCVVIADIPDDLPYEFHLVGVFALLDQRAQHIAEYASEILMARVGKEAAAVGEHTDEL